MYLILDIIITFIAYTLVPFALFFKRKDKYEEKRKQTIIICNSIVIAIIFIIIRELLGVENSVQSFMPAFIYYIINSTIWNSKQINLPSKTKRKAKKKKMHVNLKFISTIIIIIFLIASLITNLYFYA